MTYLTNAFSLNMITPPARLHVNSARPEDIPESAISALGHSATAEYLTWLLGRPIPMNRQAISLKPGDSCFVTAIYGPDGSPFRAPEGHVLTLEQLRRLSVAIVRIDVELP